VSQYNIQEGIKLQHLQTSLFWLLLKR